MVIERVYDTKFINEQGFLSEDLYFRDFVDPDTEEMLFEVGEDKPAMYKDEMLSIMRDCMTRLKSEEDVNEAVEAYEKYKDIELDAEQDTFYNCSPGKTQEHGIPLHKTEEESAQKEEESPSSGQGRP